MGNTVIARIEQALVQHLALSGGPSAPPRLMAAMGHAVFPGGARIRPQLCVAVARACGQDAPELTDAAGDEYAHESKGPDYLIAALDFSGRHQSSLSRYHATVSAKPSVNVCWGA